EGLGGGVGGEARGCGPADGLFAWNVPDENDSVFAWITAPGFSVRSMKLRQNRESPGFAPSLSRAIEKRPSVANKLVTKLPFSSVTWNAMMRLSLSTVRDTSTESICTCSWRYPEGVAGPLGSVSM